ncbi:hypothetical protein [Streptomyces sp. NPDC048106]|uniref:hypothetical protein n=1 Tax=Streptomyces sp. NPDC048106 TaxID=3155750 RepID=UPI003454A672
MRMRRTQPSRVRRFVSAVCAAALGFGLLVGAGAVSGDRGGTGAGRPGGEPGLIKSLE